MDAPRPARTWLMLLLVTLVVSVALLVRVAHGKRAAEESWSDLYELATHPHAGMYVPVFEAHSLDGDLVPVGEAPEGQRQLLYFFTTKCPYCRASIPTWKALGDVAGSRPDVDVYGVAVDSSSALTEYRTEHALAWPIVRMANARYARLFRVSGVPLTMVVEPGGRVVYARRGEFSSGALLDSVRTILDRPLAPAEPTPAAAPSVADPREGEETPSS